MNGRIANLLAALLATSSVFVSVACCDDDKNEDTKINGTFTVENMSYSDKSQGASVKALEGDTLKIVFSPERMYENLAFAISCGDGLQRLNDSLYVVKELNPGENKVPLSAQCNKEAEGSSITYSASEELTLIVPEAYVIMPYKVAVSQDLLDLVDAEVTYTDAEDESHSYLIPNESWTRSDSITYQRWKDATGTSHLVTVGKDNIEAGWTFIDEKKYLPTPYYTFRVRYYKMGITSNVTVRYIPKKGMIAERDSYEFYHNLERGNAIVEIPGLVYIDNSISINIGGDGKIKKDDVKTYIEKLENTPDVIKLNIDPQNGRIKEIK